MTGDGSFIIRDPRPAERRACRMLLPRATEPGERCRLFVAASGEPQRVIGAAALGPDLKHEGRRWLVDVHVIEPFRRRGVARALLRPLIDEANAHHLKSLRARDWVEPESDAARAWSALGFVVCQRRSDYRVDLTEALNILSPLVERIRDRIPPGARIISLAEADLDAVAKLHQEFLGGNPRVLLPLLNGTAPDRYDAHLSSVLTLDGQVVGMALGRTFADGTCEVDSRVLHPSVRRRWANVWLTYEGFRRIHQEGIRVMKYFTLDAHEDTRQLGGRLNGALTGSLVLMGLELCPPGAVERKAAAPPDAAG
jgi:ribosomal protein S18 acetylase RimI-like enzyme